MRALKALYAPLEHMEEDVTTKTVRQLREAVTYWHNDGSEDDGSEEDESDDDEDARSLSSLDSYASWP